MSRNLIILVVIVLIVGGGAFFFLNSNGSSYLSFLNSSEVTKDESVMEGEPQEDLLVKDMDESTINEMTNLLYQYEGQIADVTSGEVRGVNTNGEALGVAKSNYDSSQYLLFATFENLPDPQNDDFYEGWVVQRNPFMFISTGIVNRVDRIYTNGYKSGEDLTNYDFYVLTLEPNDGDPAPADHILEGIMK